MGGQESKGESRDSWMTRFNEEEQKCVTLGFVNLTREPHLLMTNVDFQQHLSKYFNKIFADKLFTWFALQQSATQSRSQHEIDNSTYGRSLAILLRGTTAEQSEVIQHICCKAGEAKCPRLDIEKLVEEFMQTMFIITDKSKQCDCWEGKLKPTPEAMDTFNKSILSSLKAPSDSDGYSLSEIEDWLNSQPLLSQIFRAVINDCFGIINEPDILPTIPSVKDICWSKFSTILTIPYLFFLCENLPLDHRKNWRLLYSNRLYGDSFSQLATKIVNQGPTVLLIQDKSGRLFGGYTSVGWELNGNFIGDTKCFLFSLLPSCDAYSATGFNDHYMYLNHGMETLPNGLGMGGQFEYFGLWIDSSFNIGHSKAKPKCTTYGSPQLSENEQFDVSVVEVWAVGPEPRKEEVSEDEEDEETKKHQSILDKDPESKAMLSIIGRGPISEGLREADATADSPEEKSTKVLSLF